MESFKNWSMYSKYVCIVLTSGSILDIKEVFDFLNK